MADAVPERPKEGAEPSKNALKKAQKEAEKAAKKAAAKAKEQEQQAQSASQAQDVSKEDYGGLPKDASTVRHNLTELKDGEETVIRLRVHNARKQSAKLGFLELRQGLESIQAVIAESPTLSRQMVKWAQTLNPQSIVLVHGLAVAPKEPVKSTTISNLELHVRKLYLIEKAESPLPIQIEDAERPLPTDDAQESTDARPLLGLATRLDNRVLDLRANLNQAIVMINSGVKTLFTEHMLANKFTWINTPKLLGAPSEGGSNVFEVKYFERRAYLAQSPQLFKQMMIAAGQPRVFEIGPVFRAENSNTNRHLTEFTGLDLEMEFENHYHEVLTFLEHMILHILNGLNEKYAKYIDLVRTVYNVEPFKLPPPDKVPRIPFKEGIKMLREAGEEVGDHDDLSTTQEKKLGKLVLDKYGTDFYVLDQFPLAVRPFYTHPSEEPGYSNSYDFFMRGQEICSGAQRIQSVDLLRERMKAQDPPLDPEDPGLKDYIDAFKYGVCRHGGGGFGLERIVMLWPGLPNVRLASLFPRDPQRLAP